jgi:alanyl-tRNA synthetase
MTAGINSTPTSAQVREKFLSFFESKGHHRVRSAPIVIKNDPTLMFTNAGMNQFKDWFLGNEPPRYKRVVDTQKCLRVSGKHNDLEEVGVDTYHHTMFEMLGNWSFGDYFKKEAIEWAWELLTKEYGLDKDRLYVTVFEGDEKEGLAFDQDSYNEWKKWIPEDRILKGNKKDNFWEMGDTGPCGPCSEIHIDLRPNGERTAKDGKLLVNNDDPQVIEIWNNVFMEFNRKADGSLEKLPAQHVDTGMGFERLCRAIEGKSSNYDTDVFMPLIRFIEQCAHKKYGFGSSREDIAMRVLADHIRAISFCIADGQLPSNTGAGYVIRRILRRAVRYGFQFLGFREPVLFRLCAVLAENFKNVFPELKQQEEFVARVIREEEHAFLRTLSAGIQKLNAFIDTRRADENLASKYNVSGTEIKKAIDNKLLPGAFAFELFDTCGFPIDLTRLIAKEQGWGIDYDGFTQLLAQQKTRSRKATELTTDDWQVLQPEEPTKFLGYDALDADVRIMKYRKVKAKGKEQYQLVFNQTPFYPEGGGQVGDTGVLSSDAGNIRIINTVKENNLIIHIAHDLPADVHAAFHASVDAHKRHLTEDNHSATHLLHAALRKVLGTHVQQKGSLVNADYLRFDFSHFSAMTDDEIAQVEHLVNEKIRQNIRLDEKRSVPIKEAEQMGAMMLFGEKYGESVRVITFGENYSRELCGGTHVKATGQIGLFKIVSESAVAAGVRRIEAITADAAEAWMNEQSRLVNDLKEMLKAKDIIKSVEQLVTEKNELQKKLAAFESRMTQEVKQSLKSKIISRDGINLLVSAVEISSADQLKNLSFELKNETENLVCVLGAVVNDKPLLSIIISENVVSEKKLNAGNMVKELAREIQGGGGGQPFYATAGGNKKEGLDAALEKARNLLS